MSAVLSKTKLRIAGIIIEVKSRSPMQPLRTDGGLRYAAFIYKGKARPQISLNVELEEDLSFAKSLIKRKNKIFTSVHPLDRGNNWSLYRNKHQYVIEWQMSADRKIAILDSNFKKGTIHLLPGHEGNSYALEDIIYDTLQVILINYLADKKGVLIHSIGLKDTDGSGLLFAGPTQSGKSTTARLWHRYSRAEVLNDDRIIARKVKGKFFIFGTPWHGDFRDYPKSTPDKAELKKIFFIYHHPKHQLKSLGPADAFKYLYPNIFPTFWNKKTLFEQTTLCQDLVNTKSCFHLGFKKNRSVISFVSRYARDGS